MGGLAFAGHAWPGCLRAAIAGVLLLWAPEVLGRDYPLPPRGTAIEAPPTAPLAGAWIGEARAPDRTYKILLFHTSGARMYDGTVNYDLRCVILEPPGLEESYCKSTTLDGDATTLKATMIGEYGESQKGLFWASSATGELSFSLGGDGTLSGTWTESNASFARFVPRISLAEATAVRLEDLEYEWRHFRENGGSWKDWQFAPLRVVLTGEDLPPTGFGVGEIVVDDPHFELYRAYVAEDGKLQVDFRLHEGVEAGKKRMTLAGGATAEFDLVISQDPGVATGLRFVRRVANAFAPIDRAVYGEPFYLEATFDGPASGEALVATLAMPGSTAPEAVLGLSQAAGQEWLYRSRTIRFERPTGEPQFIPDTGRASLPSGAILEARLSSYSGRIALLSLPENGRMVAKGMVRDMPRPPLGSLAPECSCRTVRLARVETRDTVRTGIPYVTGVTETYTDTRHFELGETLIAGLALPQLDHGDQMCFYFTFPEEYAYLSAPGESAHPCRAIVQIRYPHTQSSTGWYENGWQLFDIQGFASLTSAATNYVCLVVSPKGHRIPPGNGWIASTAGKEICPRVAFTVR